MKKHEDAKSLTIASGIIAILGGLLITNAIVSFIGAYRIFKAEKVDKAEKVAIQNKS